MAQVDVIITPLTGNIVFYDNDLAAQNSVSIQGESQGVLYFAGDGVNIPSSGLTAPTSSTNPNQSALPYPGQAANASASNSLFVILDSITGTITPGLSGYEMGSSTLPWRYWGTSANFSGAITLAATSSLFLANTGGANGAPLTFSASASAPTSLSAGQMWWDGTNLNFRTSSTKTVLWSDLSNIGTSVVPVVNGGTGLSSWTANSIPYISATNTFAQDTTGLLYTGSTNKELIVGGGVGISVTNPGQKLDIGYGNLRFTQLVAPGAPTVAVGSAGTLTGTYFYVVTYVTALGETNTGTLSASVVPSAQQVNLTAIPTDPLGVATSRNIYRTNFTANGAANSPYYLLANIADNTTTVFTDNTADGSLGTTSFNSDKENTTAAGLYLNSSKYGLFGLFNVGIGIGTLSHITSGYSNVAIGTNACSDLTTGQSNVAIGWQALSIATTGINNTSIGSNSGLSAVTGSNLTLVGTNAGRLVTANNNTMIGNASGYQPNGVLANATTSGATNTFLGYQTGAATTAQITNSIAIGAGATVTGNNQAAIGGVGRTVAVNLGISNNNPSQRLDIGYGHLKFTQLTAPTALTATAGSAGTLTGNYFYMVTFVTGTGATSAGTVSTVVTPSAQQVNLTNIPVDALNFATSRNIYRTATGGVSTGPFFLLTTIADNTTTVFTDNTVDGSLGTVDFTNIENTTAGLFYLDSTVTGFFGNTNIVFGESNFYTNNTGLANTGFGKNALSNNTTGIRNTAVGLQALLTNNTGSYNTALGYATLNNNTTGSQNTAVGYQALASNTTGTNNAAGSYHTLTANINGGQNSGFGSGAGASTTYGSYVTALGYGADVLVPGSFTLALTAGSNLGIGAYFYLVTFVINSNETSTNSNAVNITTTSGNQAINLSAIPTYTGPYTATRKIYRTKVGGSINASFFLLTTIADNTTTTFADTTADSSLVTAYSGSVGSSIITIGGTALALYARQMVIGGISAPISDGYIGNGVYATTPIGITLHSTGGQGTNIAGSNFVISPGQGTGTAAGGFFSVQTASAGSSGSIFNALTERFRIDSTGLISVKGSFNAGSSAQVTIDTSGNIVTSGTLLLTSILTINGATSGFVSFTAPATSGSQAYTLPTAYPVSSGYVLASTTGGTLSWVSGAGVSIGGPITGGTDTEVLFVNSGNLAQDATFTFNYTNKTLNLTGSVASVPNLIVSSTGIGTTSKPGVQFINTTASTSGAPQQQSPGLDFIGHVWNTTPTAADNTARFRTELQVTSGTTPTSLLVWRSSIDTGTASFSTAMSLTNGGTLTLTTGLTIASLSGVLTASSGVVSASASLPINLGGTNSTASSVAGAVVYSSASAMLYSAAGTTGQLLLSGGTGSPTWSNLASILTATGGAGVILTGTTTLVATIDQSSSFTPSWNGLHTFTNGLTVSAGTITLNSFNGVVKAISGVLSASAITNADLSGSAGITNANLANSSITVTAGANISVTGGSPVALGGSVTINAVGVFNWNTSANTTSPISALANTGYLANNATGATTVVYNLPVPAVGTIIEITAIGNTGGFQAVASAGVTIRLESVVSATAGSASSTGAYDSIKLLGTSTTTWQIISSTGRINIV